MNRKQDRRRRLRDWLLIVAGGVALAMTIPASTSGAVAILLAALAIAHRRMIAPPGVPILTWHSVSPDPAWLPWSREISVHPDTFATQLATIAAMRCTVIATETLVAARRDGTKLPRDCVVLHFDDGYLDNIVHALPALRRHAMPATIFASLDFIAPDDAPRDDAAGYLNWRELTAIDADPLFTVAPHGIDHGRVPVSDRIVDRLTPANWGRHAWVQWAAMPGPKHDWFRTPLPVAVPIGAPVYASALALAAPGRGTDRPAFERRITDHLGQCRIAFTERLGRAPTLFCWPENAVGDDGRRIAATLGYHATTGGRGRNTHAEPPQILSRMHVGDRALGLRWQPAEALWLRASIRLWQGNHYWYPPVAAMNLIRRIVMRMHDRP